MSDAYKSEGKRLTKTKKQFLLYKLPEDTFDKIEDSTMQMMYRSGMLTVLDVIDTEDDQGEQYLEIMELLLRYFFYLVGEKSSFGPLERIEEEYGFTIVKYGLSSGPFYDMATVYWTFKIEVHDLFSIYDCAKVNIAQILLMVENLVAGLFFPTRGPAEVPISERRERQRETLIQYCPDMDIDRFLAENPFLRWGSSRNLF